jgi:hypothetical protein
MLFSLFACQNVMVHDLAPPAEEEVVELAMPASPEKRLKVKGPDVLVFTVQYDYGELPQLVYASGHKINLRSLPSTSGDVVAKIPLGMPITILEEGKEAQLGERKDHWYKVETFVDGKTHTGYLFGPTMTPHRIAADFDGDGIEEQVFASYNERHELLIRLYDPNSEELVRWTNMGSYGSDGEMSLQADLKIFPASIAGMPLIKIDVGCFDGCAGMSWTKFVSYTGGELIRALEYSEQEAEGSYTAVELDFHPSGRRITMGRLSGRFLEDGSERIERIPEIWKFQAGSYTLQNRLEAEVDVVQPPAAEEIPLLEDGEDVPPGEEPSVSEDG